LTGFRPLLRGLEMAFKYIDADKARIATAALTGRIFLGVPDPAGNRFVGVTKDVTSDCLKAVVDKVVLEDTSMLVVTENGAPAYEITVKKIGATQ